MHILEVVEDELTASVLGVADAVLVAEVGSLQGFLFSLLPRVVFCVNVQVVFVEGFFVLVERLGYLHMFEVDGVDKDKDGDFAWF